MEDNEVLTIRYNPELVLSHRSIIPGDVLKFKYGNETRIVLVDEPVNHHFNVGGWDLARRGSYRTFKVAGMSDVEHVAWLNPSEADD